jgi:hypothetical protein
MTHMLSSPRLGGALLIAALAGCSTNSIIGMESGEKGVFFKRLSVGCVVGKAKPTTLSGVELDPEEVYPGESVAHIASIERCTKEGTPPPDSIRVVRQIVVGGQVVATNTEEVAPQIDRNGVWEVRSMINIGKNPPGTYQVRTTLEADGRRQIEVETFTVLR